MSENQLGQGLALFLATGGGVGLALLWSWIGAGRPAPPAGAPQRQEVGTAILAAVLSYGFFAAAALMSNAQLPEYFQNHLFDGLGPAVFIGFAVQYLHSTGHTEQQPALRTRVIWLALGAIPFGLIGAAASFTATGAVALRPTVVVAGFGGLMFSNSRMVYF